MILDKHAHIAGFQSIQNGIDSANSPNVLPPTQLAWMVNATARGGFPTTRPGWKKQTLRYMDESASDDTDVQDQFETGGLWQGAGSYLADNGYGYLLCSIGGHIMRIRCSDMDVTDLTNSINDYNSPVRPLSYFCQAENFLIIQNAHEKPFIYNGATLRRSLPSALGGNEVPSGSVMEYNKGRLWVASPSGDSFVAGDLVYSINGTRADLLTFTENEFLTGGGRFSVPAQAGRITAMRSLAVQDTSTGQGPLQVCTSKGAFSVDAPFDRELWQATTNPIETISLLSNGPVAHNATVVVNGDVWFRSTDGVRSLVVARREQGAWTNTPLSRENDRALGFDTQILLDYASAVLFDNRMLCTVGPRLHYNEDRELRGVTHPGLAVLDFAPVSQMFNRSQPNWEGLWTGLDILQIVTVEDRGTTRCFAFAIGADYKLELWEITKDARFDFNGSDNVTQDWVLETPSYGFDDGGWNLKRMAYGDLWLSKLSGQLEIIPYYRCDNDPTWRLWKIVQQCAPITMCAPLACAPPTVPLEQYRPRIHLPSPAEECEATTLKPSTLGYRFAVRFLISGVCSINQLRLTCRDESESGDGECEAIETCASAQSLPSQCQSDYGYRSDGL
jgi:hypothetical protein